MKIIIEEIKKDPNCTITSTTPCAGVKEARGMIIIEENDKLKSYCTGEIIKIPFILYVNSLKSLIKKDFDEFSPENLSSLSKKDLKEWISKIK